MRKISALLLAAAASLSAEFIIKDPKACAEAGSGQPIVFEESPMRLALGDAAAAAEPCHAYDEKGGTVRVWKYPHQYQRLAAAKVWKIVIEKGDGDRTTLVLPANSVIGIFLEQQIDGKWKTYRGPRSNNPIALTQPAIVFNLDKMTSRGSGGLKQEFLVWEAMTVDSLPGPAGGAVSLPAGAEFRAASVWVWQGINPIPKKHKLETGKAKITFTVE